MSEQIYVNDLRLDGDSTFSLVPRCTTFEDINRYFFTTIDRQYGWDLAPNGELVFKLVGFSIRTGPSFFNKVMKPDATPLPGVLMNAYYPNFQADPSWEPLPRYEARAFGDFTNSDGVWGLAIGGLLLNLEGRKGPLTLWPFIGANNTPPRYSDAVRNVGWYPATDHLAVHPEWQIVMKTGGVTPPSGNTGLWLYKDGQAYAFIPAIGGQPPTSGFNGLAFDDGTNLAWHVEGQLGTPETRSLFARVRGWLNG